MTNKNCGAHISDPLVLAKLFSQHYYGVLLKKPSIAHQFYKDDSQLSWPDQDGNLVTVTSMERINEVIMAEDYDGSEVDVANVDSQYSQMGGIMVVVTGTWRGKKPATDFSQTFFLAPQEKGYYILNDIFRWVYHDPTAITQQVAPTTVRVTPGEDEDCLENWYLVEDVQHHSRKIGILSKLIDIQAETIGRLGSWISVRRKNEKSQ